MDKTGGRDTWVSLFQYSRFSRVEIILCYVSGPRPSHFSPVPDIQNSEDDHSADDHEALDDHTRGGEVLKLGT